MITIFRPYKLTYLRNIVLTAVCFFLFSDFCNAGIALQEEPNDAQAKTLGVRYAKSDLDVDIRPVKSSFQVNESIRLKVKGNQPYYLYLFNINPETQEAVMVLPNRLQASNLYNAKSFIVPERFVEFFSDRPGLEKMIMVASPKPLPIDFNRYQSISQFVSGKSNEFEKSLGVRFHNTNHNDNSGVIVKAIDIPITDAFAATRGQPTDQVENSDWNRDTVSFVSTAFNTYYDGDRFELVFGANQPGYVHLYSVSPDGEYDLLKVAEVDGKTLQHASILATSPFGVHTLFALFDTNRTVDYAKLAALSIQPEKSLILLPQSNKAIATHQIQILQRPR